MLLEFITDLPDPAVPEIPTGGPVISGGPNPGGHLRPDQGGIDLRIFASSPEDSAAAKK